MRLEKRRGRGNRSSVRAQRGNREVERAAKRKTTKSSSNCSGRTARYLRGQMVKGSGAVARLLPWTRVFIIANRTNFDAVALWWHRAREKAELKPPGPTWGRWQTWSLVWAGSERVRSQAMFFPSRSPVTYPVIGGICGPHQWTAYWHQHCV